MNRKFKQDYGTKPPFSSNGWTKENQEDKKEENRHPPKITETVNKKCE